MTVRIGDERRISRRKRREGTIRFHEWIGDGWAILFSHPKDFTPVCTTELGYLAQLKPEFDKRNTKVIGLSASIPVDDHERWAKDIEETQGTAPNYPIIGDADLTVAKLYDMIHPERDAARRPHGRRQRDDPLGVRRSAPTRRSSSIAHLPDEHGPQLRRGAARARLDPAHGEAQGRDARELEAGRGRHHRARGVRRRGEAEVSRTAGRRRSRTCASCRSRSRQPRTRSRSESVVRRSGSPDVLRSGRCGLASGPAWLQ